MVKKINKNIAVEIDKLNEHETSAVLDYISQIVSTRQKAKSRNNQNTSDELIASLADAYENKRANQVFEWEKARRQNAPQRTTA